jgi:hypothetical protein
MKKTGFGSKKKISTLLFFLCPATKSGVQFGPSAHKQYESLLHLFFAVRASAEQSEILLNLLGTAEPRNLSRPLR